LRPTILLGQFVASDTIFWVNMLRLTQALAADVLSRRNSSTYEYLSDTQAQPMSICQTLKLNPLVLSDAQARPLSNCQTRNIYP